MEYLKDHILNHPHAGTGLGAFGCLTIAIIILATPMLFPLLAPIGIQAVLLFFLVLGIAFLSKLAITAFEDYIA